MGKRAWVAVWMLAILIGSIACNGEQLGTVDDAGGALLLESEAFQAGGTIPQRYTCDGEDISPVLTWSEPPPGTQSLALIFDDVDAPVRTWIHWVIFDLPAGTRTLPEGVQAESSVAELGVHGANSWKRLGYGGPCPPKGAPHRYTFRLYALDTVLDLDAGASRADLDQAMEGHILAEGQLVGLYGR